MTAKRGIADAYVHKLMPLQEDFLTISRLLFQDAPLSMKRL